MSQYSIAQYKALYGSSGTEFPDNTSSLVTPEVMRQFGEDTADSLIPANTGQSATITINVSSAQLLALFSSPVTLLSAPGAGLFYVPVRLTFSFTYGTVAYVSSNSLHISYETPSLIVAIPVTDFLTSSLNKVEVIPIGNGYISNTVNAVNKGLIFTHSSGNPTTGDGTLKIILEYLTYTA